MFSLVYFFKCNFTCSVLTDTSMRLVVTQWAPGLQERVIGALPALHTVCTYVPSQHSFAAQVLSCKQPLFKFVSHPFCVWFPKHPPYLSLRLLLSAPFQWQTGPWMRIFIPRPTPMRHKRVVFSFTPLSHSFIVSESVFIFVHAAICFSLHRISSSCIKPIFWQACRDYGGNENGHSWGEFWNKISDCVFSFFRKCWFLSLMQYPVCIRLSVLMYRSAQS